MLVTLNGEQTELHQIRFVDQLLAQLGLQNKRLAVELNEEIVPRSRFSEQAITKGDRIEIIHAIGGG